MNVIVIKLNHVIICHLEPTYLKNMYNIASKLKELVAKKDLIESDIKSYNEVLESVSLNNKSLFSC